MRMTRILCAGTMMILGASNAYAQTELVLHHAGPGHRVFHEELAQAFIDRHPDIKIRFLTASPTYEDAAQAVIRQSITGQLPDIHFSGYHLLRELVTRDIPVALDAFLEQDGGGEALGYTDAALALSTINEKLYGIPFTMSTPVVFFNADLVRRAGGNPDRMPTDWDSFINLAAKIEDLDDDVNGMYYELGVDDWTTQALIYSSNGSLMTSDESDIAFDGPAGRQAVNLFQRFHIEGGQPPIEFRAARQQLLAGTLGMYIASTAGVRSFGAEVGDKFELRTAPLPLLDQQRGGVPTGGMAITMLTEDPEKQRAAWEYIKFVTGPEGQAIVVMNTGYMPTNSQTTQPEYLGAFYEQNPNWYVSVTQIPIARPWYAWPGENSVEIAHTINNNMQQIALETLTPEEALAKMASEVRALLP